MSRLGSTIRSARMKATTPPKLIPPFQSIAASGIFPTEQTNDTIATKGPIIGPQNFARIGCVTKKNEPETIGYPYRQRSRQEEPHRNIKPNRRPVHHEVMTDRGQTLGREHTTQ